MPLPLQHITITALVTVGVTHEAPAGAAASSAAAFTHEDVVTCTIQSDTLHSSRTVGRPSTPPPADHQDEDDEKTPPPTPRGGRAAVRASVGLHVLDSHATQHAAVIPLAPLFKQSAEGAVSNSALPVRIIHRRIPLTSTARVGDEVTMTFDISRRDTKNSHSVRTRSPATTAGAISANISRGRGSVSLPALAISTAIHEWNRKRSDGLGGPREWQHVLGTSLELSHFVGASGDNNASSSSGASSDLRAVVDVFVSCEPTKLTECHLSALLDTSSPSPSNMSINESICSNASTARSGVSGRNGGGGTGSIAQSVANHFPSKFWEDMVSVHQQHQYASLYRPAMATLNREFDAAVDELVTVEAMMAQHIKEKDDIIASLLEQNALHKGIQSGGHISPDHEGAPIGGQDDSHESHARRDSSSVGAQQEEKPFITADSSSVSPGIATNAQPTFSLLKQKDLEIFLLRARIAAMEASRTAEIKSFRDEVAILRESRQRTLKERVQRAATSRRLAAAMARSGAVATGQPASFPRVSASPAGGGSRQPSVGGRSGSAAKAPSRNPSPMARAVSPSLSSVRAPSAARGGLQREASAASTTNNTPRLTSPPNGPSSEGRQRVAAAAGSAQPPRHVDAAERDERLKRLEESYAKLQLRHAAARETVGALGIGSASAAEFLQSAVAERLDRRSGVRESPARGPNAQASEPSFTSSAAARRNISPLRVPTIVPGLKLSNAQMELAARSDVTGGSLDTSRAASERKGNPLLVAGNSPMRRAPSPTIAAGAKPKHSLLRTSPMRITETRTF